MCRCAARFLRTCPFYVSSSEDEDIADLMSKVAVYNDAGQHFGAVFGLLAPGRR